MSAMPNLTAANFDLDVLLFDSGPVRARSELTAKAAPAMQRTAGATIGLGLNAGPKAPTL